MKKNYIYNLLLNISNVIFPILTFPYISRVLGPNKIGLVNFADSYSNYFLLLALVGIHIYGISAIAKKQNDKIKRDQLFSLLLSVNILVGLFIFIIYIISIFSFERLHSNLNFHLIAGLNIFGIFGIEWLYQGLQKFKFIAIRSLIIRSLSLIFIYLYIKNENDNIYYLLIIVFTNLANYLINFILALREVRFSFTLKTLGHHLKPILYVYATTICVSVYTLFDSILLGFIADNEAVGFYNASTKITILSVLVVNALGLVLMPKIASLSDNPRELKELINKAYNFIIFISIPMSFGLFVLAHDIIFLFSGEKYFNSILSLKIMAFIPFIRGLSTFGTQILTPLNYEKHVFISILICTISSLLLNFILIQKYTYNGAAITSIASQCILLIIVFFFLYKKLVVTVPYLSIIQAFIGSLPFFVIYEGISNFQLPLIFTIILSVIFCGLSYFIIQKIFKNKVIDELITMLPFNLFNKKM